MAAYATRADLVQLGISEAALAKVASHDIDEVLDASSRVADSYLLKRFTLPLTAWGKDLRQAICSLAAYQLMKTRGFNPQRSDAEQLRDSFTDAMKWLKDVSAGVATPIDIVDSDTSGKNNTDATGESQVRAMVVQATTSEVEPVDFLGAWRLLDLGRHASKARLVMSASARGDFAKLKKLVAGMGRLANTAFRRETTMLLGEEMLSHVQRGFEHSTDPEGRSWAPLKYRKGKPLIDTAMLRNSISVRSNRFGFLVFTNVVCAAFHNYGGSFNRKASYRAREADSGRFLTQSLKSTRRAEFQVQGKRATRVGLSKAHTVNVTRRQFLPDADQLPRAYRLGFERVLTGQRKHYLGR